MPEPRSQSPFQPCWCGDCSDCAERDRQRPSLKQRIRHRVRRRFRPPWIEWEVTTIPESGAHRYVDRRSARRRAREIRDMARSIGAPVNVQIRRVDTTDERPPVEAQP